MTEPSRPEPIDEPHWRTWLDWAAGQGIAVPETRRFRAARGRVWEGSEFVAIETARHPETFAELLASGDLDRTSEAGALGARLDARLAGIDDEDGLHRALRQFRRREMIRVIWRDLSGAASLAETLEDLSELADVCLGRALDWLTPRLRAELGTPRGPDGAALGLVVLGMGKLGARELNLSSDVDLIFGFAAHGEVAGGPRPLANEQFFTRLAQRLVRAINNQTVDGFVFRVDTRLRPFGESGPLAMSFGALDDYYQSQAREWERYAMIKARPVAGDPAEGARLMELLRPFVYRRYLDFGAIESLRELKTLIERELYRRGMDANIKLGPGGIREIEFIGQAFQLIRGGRDPELRIRPIRAVLSRLASKGLLPVEAARQLDAAYCFLRLTENRLQAWRDRQTHLLPEDADGRRRLARAMGFADWPAFAAVLETHRRQVQSHFDALLAVPETAAPPPEPELATLWEAAPGGAREREILAQAGFADPAAASERLARFRETVARKRLGSRGGEHLEHLMPLVLAVTAASESPDLALERVLRVLETVMTRTAYLAMLSEHPVILSQLARLSAMSSWFTDRIGRHPLLLDELIDSRRLYAPPRRDELEAELDALLLRLDPDDLEQQMERLRQFSQGNVLRVAAADLTGGIPLMIVSDYLTEIAEVTVRRVLRLTFDHLVRRHGRPGDILGDENGFLVLGYGKLGGIELGYGSDLDLVFLHGSGSSLAMTDGERAISNEQFYARLGQRMIHILTTQTASGLLYEVDMRLRPDGAKGLLVRSLAAFADYQETAAWTWEHQALVRARPIAGDRALAARFAAIRRGILCREREPGKLRAEVREMRARMRANLDRSREDAFDLKQGPGGIADIEFMVQYGVLRWAARYPELADWTDNVRLLETLGRLGLLPEGAAADLTDAYKRLRAVYHRSALLERPATVTDRELQAERARARALWERLMEEGAD